MNMNTIPFDVIQAILFLLAVKDLLRFRCVSKFFKSLIDSPDFIKQHHSHSRKNNTTNFYGMIPCESRDQLEIPKFMILDLDNNSINHIPQAVLHLPPPILRATKKMLVQVMGFCDGLVALSTGYTQKEFTLWNPFTGKYKKVVLFPICSDSGMFAYGFGYDPNTDDFKLVEIWISSGIVKATIYRLKTNSWNKICVNMPIDINVDFIHRRELGPCVLADNVLYSGFFNDFTSKNEIVAFDLVKEKLHHVLIPEQSHGVMKLGVLDECLTMTSTGLDRTDIWVMKKYGVDDSWEKLLSHSHNDGSGLLNNGRVVPLAYLKGRDKVLLSSYGSCFWYDLVNGKVEYSCLSIRSDVWSRGHMGTLKGSLVAVDEWGDGIGLKRKQKFLMTMKRKTRGVLSYLCNCF